MATNNLLLPAAYQKGKHRKRLHNFGYEILPMKDIRQIGRKGHFTNLVKTVLIDTLFSKARTSEDAINRLCWPTVTPTMKAAITGSMAEAYQ